MQFTLRLKDTDIIKSVLCVSTEMAPGKDQIIQRGVSDLQIVALEAQPEPDVAIGTALWASSKPSDDDRGGSSPSSARNKREAWWWCAYGRGHSLSN